MIIYPENVKKISRIIAAAGYESYAVGGCMRDSLMGKQPSDWDMTTSARPEQMIEIFDAAGVRTIPTGLKHGTVTVVLDGEQYECTSFRIDGSYTDSRHPNNVTFTADVAEDLKRRDFTVNAMAGDPLSENDEIVDLFGGKDDISNRIIRCVGDAQTRFYEDALRILRAVRFATTLDFEIDQDTKNAAKKLCDRLSNVSAERKVVELKKILISPFADRGVDLLFEVGAHKYIHPNIKHPCVKLSTLPMSFPCRLAALLGTDGAPSLSCLKLSRLEEKQIKLLCSPDLYRTERSEQNARYLISVYGDIAEQAVLLRDDGKLADIISAERKKQPCVTIAELKVNGNDLISAGITPRNVGIIMQKLLSHVIQDPIANDRDSLVRMALDMNDQNSKGDQNV